MPEKKPILILIFFRWTIPILRHGLVMQDSKTCKAVFSLPYVTKLRKNKVNSVTVCNFYCKFIDYYSTKRLFY